MRYRSNLSNEVSLIAFLCLALGVTLSVKTDEINSKNTEVGSVTSGIAKNNDEQNTLTAGELDFPNSRHIDKERIYELLTDHNVPFCKIGDEYYTLNGNKILFYMAKEYASPIEMIITDEKGNKTTYLEPPEGYNLVGDQAIRYVEKAAVLSDDMLIHLKHANEISVIDIVDSKPYSSLLEKDLTLTLMKR